MDITIYSRNNYLVQGLEHLLKSMLMVNFVAGESTLLPRLLSTQCGLPGKCNIIDLTESKNVIAKINLLTSKENLRNFLSYRICAMII